MVMIGTLTTRERQISIGLSVILVILGLAMAGVARQHRSPIT
ncbi:hypothetical protein RA2_03746 [Roseovarius sp. A-2]|nr:hypothetical protein [Roseovarius sp. A-2]GAW36671.1 hypothetical protein RA2_03746 [Roseovarius sp. A-2]